MHASFLWNCKVIMPGLAWIGGEKTSNGVGFLSINVRTLVKRCFVAVIRSHCTAAQ